MTFRDLLQPAAAMDERTVLRRITLIVAIACAVFALAVPIGYYVLQREHVVSDLRVEAVARARAVEAVLGGSTDLMRLGLNALTEKLEERVLETRMVESRILDTQGAVLAVSAFLAPPPQLVQRIPIVGRGTAAGHVEVVGTLYPLLLETAVAASLGALLGIMLFGLMKNVPLTALQRSMSRLREETSRAEQSSVAKSAFLASMSHEIRTPMNGVIGMTGLLLGTPLNGEQQEYVETIRTSGNSLLTVINDVLDFSKIESGHMQLESQPFDLSRCIEDVFSIVAMAAHRKNLELLYLIENDVPPWIDGDVTRVRQVLVNLVNNGVKFTEHGEIFVQVSRRAGDAAKQVIEFSVRDTGIGIPLEAQSAMFRPFSQVDASTARRYEGTGLGLAICARLVKMMDGTITLASEPGKGSTFTFSISAGTAEAPVHDARSNPFAIQGKRVLLVDDNETILRILSSVTRRWGLACDLALSPQQALALLRSDTVYDMAILDYHMPGMNGDALARQIRNIKGRENVPLVLFTAVEGATISGSDGSPLFNAKLMKPLRQSQLFETLNSLVGGPVMPIRTAPQRTLTAAEREARSRLKILAAEDNPVNMRLVNVMLDKLGYRADVVGSGVEAVDALKRRSYDVVLMDVQMPEMDGVEATRHIRALIPPQAQPYIVAVTANVLYEDRQSYLDAGMNGFLGKPFTMGDLEATLAEAKRARSGSRSDKVTAPAPAALGPDALLDRERFEEIKMLTDEAGPDVFSGLVRGLEKDLAAFDAGVEGWMDKQDAHSMSRAAHSLKGSSHSLGAQALGNLFADIERVAKTGDIGAAHRIYSAGKTTGNDSIVALNQRAVAA